MLAKDRTLAAQHGLTLRYEQGSMTNLNRFDDAVFLPVAV